MLEAAPPAHASIPHFVFCAEFGNTGPDLLGTKQPILLYSFILLSPAGLDHVTEQLQNLYLSEGLALTELKSGRLLSSMRGRRRYQAIGHLVGSVGARVILSVVEKRYQVCAMIVETYLDPNMHDFAPSEMREPFFRQKFCDACYDALDDGRLAAFLTAVRNDDAAEIAVVGRSLSAALRLHPDDFVSHAASRMEHRPDRVFRYSRRRKELPKNSHLPASQYAAFYPGLQRVDAHLNQLGSDGLLLRDEDAQFGEPLDMAFERARELDELTGAGEYGAVQLNRIQACRSASSADELGIQLADLSAGLFGRVAQAFAVGTPGSTPIGDIAHAWRGTLKGPAEHYFMVSDAWLQLSSARTARGSLSNMARHPSKWRPRHLRSDGPPVRR